MVSGLNTGEGRSRLYIHQCRSVRGIDHLIWVDYTSSSIPRFSILGKSAFDSRRGTSSIQTKDLILIKQVGHVNLIFNPWYFCKGER